MSLLDVSQVSRSRDEWAARILACHARSVSSIVEEGRELIAAKDDLDHGEFLAMVRDELPFSVATADMLMAIARHEAIANSYHGRNLPPSWRTLYELSRLDAPLLTAAIQAGRVKPEMERKAARALVVEYKQMAAQVSFDLRHGDFREALVDLEPGSVDAIVTDPPYPAEFLPLYGDLADLASKILKPGGVCAVMSGQTHLPRVMDLLGARLQYHWTMAYLTPGGQAVQVFPRKVNTFWKPILLYTNGDYTGEWLGDVAKSAVNDNDKRFHHWGQSESGMADLVARLSQPGDTVLDPFMGAGTTGVAAIARGRSFIGCDVNADHLETALERLERTVLERLG